MATGIVSDRFLDAPVWHERIGIHVLVTDL